MSNKRPKTENLIKFNEMTPEQRSEFGRRGSKASQEAKRKKKEMGILFEKAIEIFTQNQIKGYNEKLKKATLKEEIGVLNLNKKVLEAGGVVVLTMMQILTSKKTSPGTKLMAADMIMDRIEGRPRQKTDLTIDSDLPPPIFNITYIDSKNGGASPGGK
jgi:hypothetical protein